MFVGDGQSWWGRLHVVNYSCKLETETLELQKACKNLPTGQALSYLETDGIKERPKKVKGGTLSGPRGEEELFNMCDRIPGMDFLINNSSH